MTEPSFKGINVNKRVTRILKRPQKEYITDAKLRLATIIFKLSMAKSWKENLRSARIGSQTMLIFIIMKRLNSLNTKNLPHYYWIIELNLNHNAILHGS